MKKMYLNAAGGLLVGLFLFSCTTEDLAEEPITNNNPNQFTDVSEIDTDKIISDILKKNTENLNPDYNTSSDVNKDGLLTGSNTSKLTSLLIDQYCGSNGFGESKCTSNIYELGGFSKENIGRNDRLTGGPWSGPGAAFRTWLVSNPYTSSGTGVHLKTTDFDLASFLKIEYIDYVSDDDYFSFFRHEISAKTNAVIDITTEPSIVWVPSPKRTPTSSTGSGGNLAPNVDVNILLKDFNTNETVMIIAENTLAPWGLNGFSFSWRIPNTVPTGEYYVEIQDVTDSSKKNYEHYITKLIIENTEVPDFITDFVNPEDVISSPGDTYNYNLGFNRGEITVEWDPEIFDEDFLNITMSSIDLLSGTDTVENHKAWVRNSFGTYTIPADSYGIFAIGILTIQSTTKGTGKAFSISN